MTATVLVVDDIEDMRSLAAINLRKEGFDVAEAANGAEALEYLRTHDLPDAILLDLRMPVMDGWEFLELQEQDERLSGVPVVLYSSEVSFYRKAQHHKAVSGVILKPATAREYADALKRATAGHSNIKQQLH